MVKDAHLLKPLQIGNVSQRNRSSFESYARIDTTENNENIDLQTEDKLNAIKWERPALHPIDQAKDDIIFQHIDCDVYSAPERVDNKTVIHIYGVTEEGYSIMVHMFGYVLFFYILVPENFNFDNDADVFVKEFNHAIEQNVGHAGKYILSCSIEMKQSIYGYREQREVPFLKISLSSSKYITMARKILESGFSFVSHCPFQAYETFNSSIDVEVRCLADLDYTSCGWFKASAGKYEVKRGFNKINSPFSRCQLEISLDHKDLISLPCEGKWMKIAPLRILSFDIECLSPKGTFPDAQRDSVIQIANMVQTYGTDEEPSIRNVFTLKKCARILGSHILSFEKESALLDSWANFFRIVDPDVITGYNIQNFDFPFLLTRANVLKLTKFPYIGRSTDTKTVSKSVLLQSKQFGRRESHFINLEGRFLLDIFQVLTREYKLRSYSLNSVSYHFLGEQKEDVHHSIISDLQNGTPDTRRRLAIYCLKDAYLPLRLLNKLLSLVNYIEMARTSGVNLTQLLTRGQQIKVVSQLLRKANRHNYVIPTIPVTDASEEYVGGEVLDPIRGYYNTPITTLDFASLYPSIMIAYNMCYTTWVTDGLKARLSSDQYFESPNGGCFVKPDIRKGVLPEVLEELLEARKRTKNEMKTETDPFRKSVLDGRQLALKITANSVYGFTGAQAGKLPCLAISQGITSFGRQMIEKTKHLVETQFIMANGYPSNAQVIYGDTDSVMVKFNISTLEDSMKIGKEAAAYVSSFFQAPIQLQFEKCYLPFLLINKKRYAGLSFTKTDKYDRIDCKGIETVRRDNCPLVANCISVCLRKLLVERKPDDAVAYVKEIISDLLCNRTDISQLIITKELTKSDRDYAAKQAHVELANKMKKRDPGSAPNLGDRVPFVIVAGSKGQPTYQRAEDPVYVLENNLPIDSDYYLENQLSKPLLRVLEPVLGDNAESLLFKGQHTLVRTRVTAKVGALLAFTKKKATCFVCRAVLDDDSDAVCIHCQPKRRQCFLKEMGRLRSAENRFRTLWTECQRCQGNLLEDIICTNRDCPIFFARTKVRGELSDMIKRINQFKKD